jgi:hypothetical protein
MHCECPICIALFQFRPSRYFAVVLYLDSNHICAAANGAVFDILLPIALRGIDGNDDFLAASTANVTGFVEHGSSSLMRGNPRTDTNYVCLRYMATYQAASLGEHRTAAEATLAKSLAPEEIRAGDYVTPLSMIAEVPSFWWRDDAWNLPLEEPVRMRFMATCDGLPLRVQSICLPFVLAKQPSGQAVTIDIRRCQLARLDRSFAKQAWKCIKRSQRKGPAQAPRQSSA